MIRTRVFDRDFLVNELDLPDKCIHAQLTGHSRWSLRYRGVFEYEGRFYRVSWNVGATEHQDERPWEYEDEVTATEVVKRPVTEEQWVPAEGDAADA